MDRLRPVLEVDCVSNYWAQVPTAKIAGKYGGLDSFASRVRMAHALVYQRTKPKHVFTPQAYARKDRRKHVVGKVLSRATGIGKSRKRRIRAKAGDITVPPVRGSTVAVFEYRIGVAVLIPKGGAEWVVLRLRQVGCRATGHPNPCSTDILHTDILHEGQERIEVGSAILSIARPALTLASRTISQPRGGYPLLGSRWIDQLGSPSLA